jgi:hypothetical protein
MADLRPIEYPEQLNRHTLTEQELANLTPPQQALAKDWNIINRKIDWMIHELVEQHNVLVQHDALLDTFKKWLWLSGLSIGGTGTVGGIIWAILKFGGHQ